MRKILLLLTCSLISCTVLPERLENLTPAQCRTFGVAVQEGDTVTGTVIDPMGRSVTFATTERECGGSYGMLYAGCAVPVEGPEEWPSPSHQYNIWYADHKCAPEHEACHARYEHQRHTVAFEIRRAQGDKFAYCPPNAFNVWKHNLLSGHQGERT